MIKIDKCKSCGTKIIKNPIWRGQEQDIPFSWDRLILKNLFKIDAMSAIMLILILFGTWAYFHDTAECREIVEDPCTYYNESGCLEILKQRQTPGYMLDIPTDETLEEHIKGFIEE